MEIFKLVKASNLLPGKLDELVPMSFIGQAAISFYRAKIRVMDQLKMTEEQRKATLRDGQDAGEMLLDIVARIGELLPSPEESRSKAGQIHIPPEERKRVLPEGINRKQARHARIIKNNPEVVAKIKAQARENDDIPTKTAVINAVDAIRYKQEVESKQRVEANKEKDLSSIPLDQADYLSRLRQVILVLPKTPPKRWNNEAFKEAQGYAKIIIKRLEEFSWNRQQIQG